MYAGWVADYSGACESLSLRGVDAKSLKQRGGIRQNAREEGKTMSMWMITQAQTRPFTHRQGTYTCLVSSSAHG